MGQPAKYSFTSQIDWIENMKRYALIVPPEIEAKFPPNQSRVLLTIGDVTLRRALNARKKDPRILLGKKIIDSLGLELGTDVKASLEEDPDPDHFDIPPEFTEALSQDDVAKTRWDSFSLGRQRSLIHYVTSAKREDTRIRRAVELCEKLRTYTLYGDQPIN